MLIKWKNIKTFVASNGKSEIWRLIKYGIVGGSSLVIHAGLYYIVSREIWPDGPKTLEYVLTMLCVGVYNFTMHRIWTFSLRRFSSAMVLRYLMAVGFGVILQSGIFSLCYDVLNIADYYAFGISVGLASFIQYCIQRFFTFSDRFEKEKIRKQEEIPTPLL